MRQTAWQWHVIQAARWMAEVADDVEDFETVLSVGQGACAGRTFVIIYRN